MRDLSFKKRGDLKKGSVPFCLLFLLAKNQNSPHTKRSNPNKRVASLYFTLFQNPKKKIIDTKKQWVKLEFSVQSNGGAS
jgi:hypothetical protein